jgi:AcrR family transcriptional regulator
MRERILGAASDLVHEFKSWDWRPLTFRAVAERAGVGERTVYRYFTNEQLLHEAVMHRLGEESGVDYEDLSIDDVHEIGARVFAAMSTFAAPPSVESTGSAFVAEDARRRAALVTAVGTATSNWQERDRLRAAAALDVLWNAPSYARLINGWNFTPEEATLVIDWMIGLVVLAVKADGRPSASSGLVGQRSPS